MKKIISVLTIMGMLLSCIVYGEEAPAEDNGIFVMADYDTINPSLEKAEGSEPKHSIETDSTGNKYLKITPAWSNWGYALSTPIPKNGGDYTIQFDFAGNDLQRNYYPIALTEVATEKGENVYHQFGLLGLNAAGNFRCAGRVAEGMTYEDGKWYHYKLIFNRSTKNLILEITDKANPENKAILDNVTAGAVAGAQNYGNGLPDRSYDMIKFAISGTLYIDNLIVEESRERPLSLTASSTHVGNVFDGRDVKLMNVNMRNVLNEPIKADLSYFVIDEDGNEVERGNIGSVEAKARERIEKQITLKVEKFNTYDLYFDVSVENLSTGEKKEYISDNTMFSVANKLNGEPLNRLTASNIEFVNNPKQWQDIKEMLLQAGISGIRKDYTWYMTETLELGKGNYTDDIPSYGHFSDAVASGLDNLAILLASNPLYSVTGNDYGTMSIWNVEGDEIWNAWEKYIHYAVKRDKDRVTYWEILNEPDGHCSPELYCRAMKVANKAIKAEDPDSCVLGLCTASMPWAWIESVLKIMGNDWKDYCDAISVHPYDFDGGKYRTKLSGLSWAVLIRDQWYMDKMVRMKDMMKKYGCEDAPLFITEMSITSTPKVISMKGQAAELAQLYAVTEEQGIIQQLYWYCFENTSIRGLQHVIPNDTEGNFGLVGNRDDPVPYAAKPSYIALCAYNKLLSGAKVTEKIVNEKTRAYRFTHPDGREYIMLWSEEGSKNISLDLGTTDIELYDMYSNFIGKVSSPNGRFDFTPGFEPIYIKGSFSRFEECDGNITADSGEINAVTSDKCVINMHDKKGRVLRVEAEGTPYAKIVSNSGISGGEGRLVIETTDEAFEEEPITVKVYDGDTLVYFARYYIVIQDEGIKVSYSLGDDPTGADRSVVNVSVTNDTAGVEMNGTIEADFTKIGGKNEQRTILGLKPHETKTVFLNIPKTSYAKSVASVLKLHFGGRFEDQQDISVINDFTVAYNSTDRKDASLFDGNFNSNEWFAADDELAADSFGSAWGGPDDCSFKGTLGWDEKNLYIYCDVKDDIFNQKETGVNIWQGDGLQVGVQDIQTLTAAGGDLNSNCEFGVARCENGDEKYRWTVHPGCDMPTGAFDNCSLKIERIGTHTYYKIAIPWIETIGRETVSEGEEFLFDIIANDNDGTGRKGFAVLTKGIGEVKSATYFAKIHLVK